MSPDPEPPVRLTGRRADNPSVPPDGGLTPGGMSRPALIRLLVVGLSVAGVLAALVLWAAGHGTASWRVLAGDALAILTILMLAS